MRRVYPPNLVACATHTDIPSMCTRAGDGMLTGFWIWPSTPTQPMHLDTAQDGTPKEAGFLGPTCLAISDLYFILFGILGPLHVVRVNSSTQRMPLILVPLGINVLVSTGVTMRTFASIQEAAVGPARMLIRLFAQPWLGNLHGESLPLVVAIRRHCWSRLARHHENKENKGVLVLCVYVDRYIHTLGQGAGDASWPRYAVAGGRLAAGLGRSSLDEWRLLGIGLAHDGWVACPASSSLGAVIGALSAVAQAPLIRAVVPTRGGVADKVGNDQK
ncbi:hypothetical protein CDD81_286 [Ophiocordyceps australis]|uniref:Uncharacterized protein n=1 Tax=Ophiocordyceps australis TaxID=1399860 RepID=A0A2C5X8P6_9HYPO|nr:hypothetical protein CDD81_286 [Ophiocordyceps australis]